MSKGPTALDQKGPNPEKQPWPGLMPLNFTGVFPRSAAGYSRIGYYRLRTSGGLCLRVNVEIQS